MTDTPVDHGVTNKEDIEFHEHDARRQRTSAIGRLCYAFVALHVRYLLHGYSGYNSECFKRFPHPKEVHSPEDYTRLYVSILDNVHEAFFKPNGEFKKQSRSIFFSHTGGVVQFFSKMQPDGNVLIERIILRSHVGYFEINFKDGKSFDSRGEILVAKHVYVKTAKELQGQAESKPCAALTARQKEHARVNENLIKKLKKAIHSFKDSP